MPTYVIHETIALKPDETWQEAFKRLGIKPVTDEPKDTVRVVAPVTIDPASLRHLLP